jgi:hypothetical protein
MKQRNTEIEDRSQTSRRRSRPSQTKGKPPNPNYLRDDERGAKLGIRYHPKRMAMQAAPDHGDHE